MKCPHCQQVICGEATQAPFLDEVAEIPEEVWKNMRPGPIQVVYPLDEEWNAALDAAATKVKPREEPRPETPWEKGYWAGLNTASHMVTLLKRDSRVTSEQEGK